jgi:hypothetical protein
MNVKSPNSALDIIQILKLPVTDYDDEHCTWGNRRLMFGTIVREKSGRIDPASKWYSLQIIENCNFPDEGSYGGFVYAGWFESREEWKTKDGWDIHTVKDIYKIIYLYHREWLPMFKSKLINYL